MDPKQVAVILTLVTSRVAVFDPSHQMLKSLFTLSPNDPNFAIKFLSLRNFDSISATPPVPDLDNDRQNLQPDQNKQDAIQDIHIRLIQDLDYPDRTYLRQAYKYLTDFLTTRSTSTDSDHLNDYGQPKSDSNNLWYQVIEELNRSPRKRKL